jgi:DNA-3-methyladenine glycosylase II
VGPFTLKPQSDLFRLLVKAIISQQISVAAARSIMARLEQHVAPGKISAETLVQLDAPTLRGLGVSPQKISYLTDLTQRSVSGSLRLDRIRRFEDEEAIEHLVQIKGVGRWTAQMALIFGLARLDVLPVGDLGIQTAIRNAYGLRKLPKPKKIESLARAWRPYCSIASWYLWQSLDNTPKD